MKNEFLDYAFTYIRSIVGIHFLITYWTGVWYGIDQAHPPTVERNLYLILAGVCTIILCRTFYWNGGYNEPWPFAFDSTTSYWVTWLFLHMQAMLALTGTIFVWIGVYDNIDGFTIPRQPLGTVLTWMIGGLCAMIVTGSLFSIAGIDDSPEPPRFGFVVRSWHSPYQEWLKFAFYTFRSCLGLFGSITAFIGGNNLIVNIQPWVETQQSDYIIMVLGIALMWISGGLLAMGGIQPYDCPPSLFIDWAAPFAFLPFECLHETLAHIPALDTLVDKDAPHLIDMNKAPDMPQHAAYGPISAMRARNGAVYLPPERDMRNTSREHSHVPLYYRFKQRRKALAAAEGNRGTIPNDFDYVFKGRLQPSNKPKWRRNLGYYIMCTVRGVVCQLGYFLFWTGLQQQLQQWWWNAPPVNVCINQAIVGLAGSLVCGSLLGAAGVDDGPLRPDDADANSFKHGSVLSDARRIDFVEDEASRQQKSELQMKLIQNAIADAEEEVGYVPMTHN